MNQARYDYPKVLIHRAEEGSQIILERSVEGGIPSKYTIIKVCDWGCCVHHTCTKLRARTVVPRSTQWQKLKTITLVRTLTVTVSAWVSAREDSRMYSI